MPALTQESRPQSLSEVVLQAAEDELVLVLPAEGQVKVLNSTGAFIWQRLDGRSSLQEIADALSGEFAIDPESALQDVLAFTRSLLERGLITIC